MTISINDPTGILSASDTAALQHTASGLPFDVGIVAGSFASRASFEGAVSAAVTGHRVVAIGLDPSHRYVSVHFGDGAGIPRSAWDSVRSAGNASFRGKHWGDGLSQIMQRAATEQTSAVVLTPSSRPVQVTVEQTSSAALWVAGGLVLVVALVTTWLLVRSRRREREHAERMAELETSIAGHAELSDFDRRLKQASSISSEPPRRVDLPRVPPPPVARSYPSPTPLYSSQPVAPVVVQSGGGSSDLLTGMLIGESLGRHEHTRVVEVERHSHRDAESSYDSGSSSSSFDSGFDSGSSGGGFDSGGSGGDW